MEVREANERDNRIEEAVVIDTDTAKRRQRIAVVVLVVLLAAIAGTFAWFYESKEADIVAIKGSVEYADFYFNGGKGTADDPYQIDNAKQFANFAWLQYMGVFNKPVTDADGNPVLVDGKKQINQVYFKLTNNIDMKNAVIPPIGTTDNPFLGHFTGKISEDGNQVYSVKNARITNHIADSAVSGDVGILDETVPSLVNKEQFNSDDSMQIIGLFGVVGSIGSTDYTYNSSINQIEDFYLTDSTIITQSKKTLVGMVAGYVNGTLSGVTLNDCSITIGQEKTGALTDITNNLSDFGTVGYCTNTPYKKAVQVDTIDIFKPKLELSTRTDDNEGNVWGGSINMVELHTRLTNIINAGSTSVLPVYKSQTINIDEKTGAITVNNSSEIDTSHSTRQAYQSEYSRDTNTYKTGSIYAYPSPGVTTEDSGNYALHPTEAKSGSTVLQNAIGIMGRPTDLGNTVTVNRYKDEYKDAYYISYENAYLNITDDGSIDNANITANTRWVLESDGNKQTGCVYTIVNGTKYYLQNSDGKLSVGTEEDSSWVNEDGNIYSLDGAKQYHLYYVDGNWILSQMTLFYITDGEGDYLQLADDSIKNTTKKSEAAKWFYDDKELYIYSKQGGIDYYLYIDTDTKKAVATNSSQPHMVYDEGQGIYTVDRSSVDVGSWETVGTVEGSGYTDVTSYLLDTDSIDANSTYAIVSMATGSPKVLSVTQSGNRWTGYSYSTSEDDATLSTSKISDDTKLNLNISTNRTEAMQTWTTRESGTGITLYNSNYSRYLNLQNVVTANPELTQRATTGSVLDISSATERKVSFTTSGAYVAQKITNEADIPSDLESGNYQVDHNGTYEVITGMRKGEDRYGTYWYLYTNETPRGFYIDGDTCSIYTYTEEEVSNYLAHDATGDFYTTNKDSNNLILFFKKVTREEATRGVADTQYLDKFIEYAKEISSSEYSEELWNNFSSELEKAEQVKKDVTHTYAISYDQAKEEQIKVNEAATNLQNAILLLQGERCYLVCDSALNWTGVTEDQLTESGTLAGRFDNTSTRTEKNGQIQMVDQVTQSTGLPSFFPISAETESPFSAKADNTGYICGANMVDDYQAYSGDIRVAWNKTSYLTTALNTSGVVTYKSGSNHMSVLTRTAETGGLVRVADDYNNDTDVNSKLKIYDYETYQSLGLKKYQEARDNLEKALDGNDRVYGLHFMDATISKDATFVAPKVTINKKTYENYEMPEACIDFKLKEKGYINFFAGSFYNKNDSFFALYKIERNNQIITDIKEIKQVYGDPNDPTKPYEYKYDDSDSITPGYKLLFDTDWIKNPEMNGGDNYNSVFYYEIPTNEGEYALGSVNGKKGAYLLYLDISANKQEIHRQTLSELMKKTENTYEYPTGIQLTGDGYLTDTDSASISIKSNSSIGTVKLSRTDDSTAKVNTGGLGENVSSKYIGDGINLSNETGKSIQATEINKSSTESFSQRAFDYNTTTLKWSSPEEIDEKSTKVSAEDLKESGVRYHYVLPANTSVVNTFAPHNLVTNEKGETYIDNIAANLYPALGMKEPNNIVDASDRINAYDITVVPTGNSIKLWRDTLSNGFQVYLNSAKQLINEGESKTINP